MRRGPERWVRVVVLSLDGRQAQCFVLKDGRRVVCADSLGGFLVVLEACVPELGDVRAQVQAFDDWLHEGGLSAPAEAGAGA